MIATAKPRDTATYPAPAPTQQHIDRRTMGRARPVVSRLKAQFREWCGALSIKEIMGNQELIRSIERMEGMFSAACA